MEEERLKEDQEGWKEDDLNPGIERSKDDRFRNPEDKIRIR